MIGDFIVEISQKFLTKGIHRSVITANVTDVRIIQDNPMHTNRILHQRLPIHTKRG